MAKDESEQMVNEVATIIGDVAKYMLKNHPKPASALIDGNPAVIYFSALLQSLASELIEFPSADRRWLKLTLEDCRKKCKTVGLDKEGRQFLEKAIHTIYDIVTKRMKCSDA